MADCRSLSRIASTFHISKNVILGLCLCKYKRLLHDHSDSFSTKVNIERFSIHNIFSFARKQSYSSNRSLSFSSPPMFQLFLRHFILPKHRLLVVEPYEDVSRQDR